MELFRIIPNEAVSNRDCLAKNAVAFLKATTWGRVTAVQSANTFAGYFYIDDGAGLKDGSGNTGVKRRVAPDKDGHAALAPPVGSFVVVTGVPGVSKENGVNTRYFRTKSCSIPCNRVIHNTRVYTRLRGGICVLKDISSVEG